MPRVTLLGTAATLAGRENDSIYLLIESAGGHYLVDCGSGPPHKLARAGADLGRVRGVLLTHDHADHLYGFPLLVQALMLLTWEGAWSGPLAVWGLPETLITAEALLSVFSLAEAIPLEFRPIPARPNTLVLETADLTLHTTPVEHTRPTVAVRIEGKRSGRVLVYSSDTQPCPGLRQLATGVDLLLHEATVSEPAIGHSTPAQAGETAAAAGVGQLVLVHFDPAGDRGLMVAEAAKAFGGPVEVGRDWMTFEL
jgi:ribonuclease Z